MLGGYGFVACMFLTYRLVPKNYNMPWHFQYDHDF